MPDFLQQQLKASFRHTKSFMKAFVVKILKMIWPVFEHSWASKTVYERNIVIAFARRVRFRRCKILLLVHFVLVVMIASEWLLAE